MLSRTADHLFWMSRYTERAENTARMLDVNYQTSLLPQSTAVAELGWQGLLKISELLPAYQALYGEVTPQRVLQFMVKDERNPSSIISCLRAARENARAVRGTLTTEVWETQNQTWLEGSTGARFSNVATAIIVREPEAVFDCADIIGKVIRDFLPREHLLSYLEAVLRVYNRAGRRDNIYKARIKILVKAMGEEAFRAAVEQEWALIRDTALLLDPTEIDRMRKYFRPLPYEKLPDIDVTVGREAAFVAWYRHNTRAHKVSGYRAVMVSLKTPGIAPGDMTAEQMDGLADLADLISSGEVRSTHDQNLVLGDVRGLALGV
jgi:hypothetical protein